MKKNIVIICLLAFIVNTLNAQEYIDYKAFTAGTNVKISAVTFSPNNTLIFSGNEIGTIIGRNASTSQVTHTFKLGTQEIIQLDFDPSGKYLMACSKSGEMKIWEVQNSEEVFHSHPPPNSKSDTNMSFSFFSADGTWVYYGGSEGVLYGVKFEGGALENIATTNTPLYSAAYNGGNTMILGGKGTLIFVDLTEYKITKTLPTCIGEKIIEVKYSPSGSTLAALCESGTLQFFDTKTWKITQSIKVTDRGPSTEFDFSPDGKFLVAGDVNMYPKVYDLSTMKVISSLGGHKAAVRSIAFSSDSKSILSGGDDFLVKLWKYNERMPNVPIPTPPVNTKAANTNPLPVLNNDLPTRKDKLDDIKLVYTQRNIPDSLGDRKVKTGKRVLVNSDKLKISVWDKEYEDGDTISIFLNGDWILKEYPLKNKKKTIEVTIDRNGDNYFVLYAHNEGSRPPNTAAVTIDDGIRENEVSLSSNMRLSDAVNFKFKP